MIEYKTGLKKSVLFILSPRFLTNDIKERMSQVNAVYESPFSARYASKEMLYIFSPDMKFSTWRRLWVSLAKAEMTLGLPITQEQIEEMEANIDHIDYETARQREKEVRHDVMAHVYTQKQQALSTSEQRALMSVIIPILSSCAKVCGWCAGNWPSYSTTCPISPMHIKHSPL